MRQQIVSELLGVLHTGPAGILMRLLYDDLCHEGLVGGDCLSLVDAPVMEEESCEE